jgi:2,4-dienoyl-CoA reductase-like NADH-dependent reductase (Old Yellow Enzyme family)
MKNGSGPDRFAHLRSPIALGPMQLKNRIAMLPHGLMYAIRPELRPNARHLAYYEARARGGAALICLETSVVARDALSFHSLVVSGDPGCVPGYTAIADAVHEHGAKISGQLCHYGNEVSQAHTRRPPVGPSTLGDPVLREPCVALDAAAMGRIIEEHVGAARNFADAGFDAIEVKVAHDGLMRQFLSPLTNQRHDEYGGSIENRMRFPLEIYRAIREEVGPEIALSVRLDIDEVLAGGWDLADGIEFTRLFEESGVVDYISTDEGIAGSIQHVIAPMAFPQGYAMDKVAAVRATTSLPIIAFGRIVDPELAESILREGKADVVGFARQMLADPEYANKVLAGEPERIRPCTACNQLCFGHGERDRNVTCVVNPHAGYGEYRVRSARSGERIVVVGAGPAGLEAARTCAEDGGDVVLLEARPGLGGQLALSRSTGGRTGWQPYLDWLEREVTRLGVEVRCGVVADAAAVLDLDPATVVLATGSVPGPASIDGIGYVDIDRYVASSLTADRVAVVDLGAAGPAFWFAALEAARRGAREVTLVTPLAMVGSDLDTATRITLRRDMAPHPFRILVDHDVTGAVGRELVVESVFGGGQTRVAVDLVVASTVRRSSGSELLAALSDAGLAPVVIGDALAPRDVAAAVREGHGIGVRLGAASVA